MFGKFVGVAGLVTMFAVSTGAQVALTGAGYTQNFNSIGKGLPPGWSVRTNATATDLGTPVNFNTNAVSWGSSAGQFCNTAGPTNNLLALAVGNESASLQSAFTNRCLSIRQTAAFGDPGAAFVLQIANTSGFRKLAFSVDLDTLSPQAHSTVWTVDYAIGDLPASFAPLGTSSDPGVFGTINQSYSLGADANDQSQNVWIRITALSPSTGTTGNRDTFGIDNFVLSYEVSSAAAIPLFIQADGRNAVLTWNDSNFALQASPSADGQFTNVTGATSPFTNAMDDAVKFFRLMD